MKKNIAPILAGIFILCSTHAFSQDEPKPATPNWISDNGYWVVESQKSNPLHSTVRFYNNNNVLVGHTDIDGQKLKLNKRKVKMQLKSMLEDSVADWARQHPENNSNGKVAKLP